MPAFSTHYLFGNDIKSLLDAKKSDLIEKNRGFYDWGVLGPDILFFLPQYKESGEKTLLRQIGAKMHQEGVAAPFSAMHEYAQKSPYKDELYAYLYGFICHVKLDSRIHPLVYSIADFWHIQLPSEDEFILHLKAEADMETVAIRWLCDGKLPNEFKLYKLYSNDKDMLYKIAGMYEYAIKKTYDMDFSKDTIYKSILYTFFLMKKSFDRTGYKKQLVSAFENISKKSHIASSFIVPLCEDCDRDYLNAQEREWLNIFTGETSEESFFSLYENAKYSVLTAIEDIFENGKEIENISLKTGRKL